LHTGVEADVAARGLNARAFTVGDQIAFAAGQYSPHSEIGDRLLAHELTHTLQQRDARAATVQRQDVSIPAPAERPQLTDKKIVMDQEASCGARAELKGPDYAACLSHTDFVNGMAAAVENLRKVPTTYGPGLAEVYGAFLDQIVRAGPSAAPRPGAPLRYTVTNLMVKVSPMTSMPLASLTLEIEYEPDNPNGSYVEMITLNEHNLRKNTEIERVMYFSSMKDVIKTDVLPIIHQLQIEYMRLRQGGKPKTERATPGK
jgi:Domain of unknown function (DUF4157)